MHVASISNEIFLILKNKNKQYTAVDCERMVNVIKYVSNNLDEQISFKKIVSGKGQVGIGNMGVLRMGINFQKGKNYKGLLRVKNQTAYTLYVAILNADGTVKLTEKAINLKASPDVFQKVEFDLTPSKSHTKGRFAIILNEPGEVTLGHAFLQPGTYYRIYALLEKPYLGNL